MSEKRFTVISEKIGRFHNISVQTDKIEYLLTGGFDNDSEMIKEIVDLLNELQATITELKKDLKTVIDNYNCERIGYCHKGEYCKKWSLNNDR